MSGTITRESASFDEEKEYWVCSECQATLLCSLGEPEDLLHVASCSISEGQQ